MRPTPSFIRWVAYLLLPPSLLVVWHPVWMVVTAGVLVALILVALVDFLWARTRVESCVVRPAKLLRLTRGEVAQVELELRVVEGRCDGLTMALRWPGSFLVEKDEGRMQALKGEPVESGDGRRGWKVSWNCISHERGSYRVTEGRVGMISRLGWWQVWLGVDPGLELRVYPSVAQDRRRLSALFLNRGGLGVHVQRTVGQGREFEKLREYVPGDGFEDVHWKATAKRGRPVTKVHQVERTQEVYMVLDHSRLMGRMVRGRWGSRGELPGWARYRGVTQERVEGEVMGAGAGAGSGRGVDDEVEPVLERMLSSALIMAMAAEHQGDHFGLVTYADRVDRFLRARSGPQHFQSCREALYGLKAERVTPDYEELAGVLRVRLQKRALLVYVTALDDPVLAEGFLKHVEIVARQHLVLVCMPRAGQLQPLFEGEDVTDLSELYDRLGAQLRWNDLREVQKRLQRLGAHFHLIDHEQLSLELVTHYARMKSRQLL